MKISKIETTKYFLTSKFCSVLWLPHNFRLTCLLTKIILKKLFLHKDIPTKNLVQLAANFLIVEKNGLHQPLQLPNWSDLTAKAAPQKCYEANTCFFQRERERDENGNHLQYANERKEAEVCRKIGLFWSLNLFLRFCGSSYRHTLSSHFRSFCIISLSFSLSHRHTRTLSLSLYLSFSLSLSFSHTSVSHSLSLTPFNFLANQTRHNYFTHGRCTRKIVTKL